ncbi:MAG: outer membrane lipoprotein-sorting protein [Candidatus Cloacimonetes bacterium]|nr:outer membrane lipoprotein-sorting protein [Candidatus Cloacimonadota bacterium]
MKKLILFLLTLLVGSLFAADLTVGEIIKKVDANERVESSYSTGKQIIETTTGDTRTLEMETYSKDMNDKQLMVYTSPGRVKGDKILLLDDGNEIWYFTPKTDRVRHLASHARKRKVQGSDFSYDDLSAGDLAKENDCKLLGKDNIDGRECYKIELIPLPNGTHYSKMIVWADTERFVTLRIDYYEDGDLTKRLKMTNVEFIDDRWVAKKMVMTNLLDGGQTVMQIDTIEFGKKLDDSLFTTNSLKRH